MNEKRKINGQEIKTIVTVIFHNKRNALKAEQNNTHGKYKRERDRYAEEKKNTVKCSLHNVEVVEVFQHRVMLMATPTTPEDFKRAHREAKAVESKRKSMRESVDRMFVLSAMHVLTS